MLDCFKAGIDMTFGFYAGITVAFMIMLAAMFRAAEGSGNSVYNWVVLRVHEMGGARYIHHPYRGVSPPVLRNLTVHSPHRASSISR
ncbi:MAG: hypothetical protein HZA22_09430 [Nitrospirae bacterium]|nr:hypothetical protein [Nitrospirota bacterium]MBI5695939.1 hypothetical protein [Nitrospirota bacterium]